MYKFINVLKTNRNFKNINLITNLKFEIKSFNGFSKNFFSWTTKDKKSSSPRKGRVIKGRKPYFSKNSIRRKSFSLKSEREKYNKKKNSNPSNNFGEEDRRSRERKYNIIKSYRSKYNYSNKKFSKSLDRGKSYNTRTYSYTGDNNTKHDNYNYSLSAVKISPEYDSENQYLNKEPIDNKLVRRIISEPEEPVKLSENEIHRALMKSGKLPEITIKEILKKHTTETKSPEDTKILSYEINKFLLPKLGMCLNKSLLEIAKIGKNNSEIFKKNEEFWTGLEEEILNRIDTLSNEQIVEILSAYTKAPLQNFKSIEIFEKMEEIINESPVKFLPSQIENLFYSYCSVRRGSTTLLKNISRKFFKHASLMESTRLAKFISTLNSHPNSIKGNFGLMPEFEKLVSENLNNLNFDRVVDLSHYLFTENIGSNDLHRKIEKSLIEKFENLKINDIEMSHVVKLVKSLTNYYIKNEKICEKIKNYIEVYLNAYLKKDDIEEQLSTINIFFDQQYTKLVSNLNLFIHCFSKNQMFLNYAHREDFSYFYQRLKQVFINNISFYNLRELTFSLDGLLKLSQKNNPNESCFTFEQTEIINNKIKSFDSINSHYEVVKLLKIMVQNENLLNNIESFNLLVNYINENFEFFTYGEMIESIDILSNFPHKFAEVFPENNNKLKIFENKLNEILAAIQIYNLCKIIEFISKPFKIFSDEFIEKVINIFNMRINEVPKDCFSDVFRSCTQLKLSYTVETLLKILEDLSNFENINSIFNSNQEILNLLWTMLSIQLRSKWSIKIDQKESILIEKIIQNYFFDRSINPEIDISNKDQLLEFFFEKFLGEKMQISKFLTLNLKNREQNFYVYLQINFLSFFYLKDYFNLNNYESKILQEKIMNNLYNISKSFNLNCRSNFISLDPASKCDKDILNDLKNQLLIFFKPKPNAELIENFLDEFLNPINILVNFVLPELNDDTKVIGVDSKIFAVCLINQYYYFNDSLLTIYENRVKIIEEIFKFEPILISEDKWTHMKDNEKQDYLKELFGINFENDENVKIHLSKKLSENLPEKKIPKFKLAKDLKSKK
jgi:hypothetical protein